MFENTLADHIFDEALQALEDKGLRRTRRVVQGAQSARIMIDGKEVLNLCSNNYLGLADDPRISAAARASMDEEGFGSGASRLISGNMRSHDLLEKELAAFKGTEECLVFSSGYMANVGIIPALVGRDDIIFSDRLNHASIIDGIVLSQAEFKRYPHNDMDALEELAKTSNARRKWIITDTVFSMDGDLAPLDRIVEIARCYGCYIMVDDAHGFGVFGKNGTGAAEHFGLNDAIHVHMGTLSKAAGSFGAYCCGSKSLIELLVNKARSFIYTTGMPPAVAAASRKAIEIIRDEPKRREQLWKNTRWMTEELRSAGFDVMATCSPIIPILVKDARLAVEFSRELFVNQIFVAAIRPPTVPVNEARLRLTVTAAHTQQDMALTLEHIIKAGKKFSLI